MGAKTITAYNRTLKAFFAAVLTTALICTAAGAGELMPQNGGYTEDELVTLREWEKKWVGVRIDSSTIDQVAQYLPQRVAEIYAANGDWGAPPEGYYFTISRNRPAAETRGMKQATRRNLPRAAMRPDGSLEDFTDIAGMPFPQPATGLEVAWNYDFNTHGDAAHYTRTGTNINPIRGTEKVGVQDAWELFWIHRVDVDPRPALPQNTRGVSRSTFYHMYSPPEFKNIRMFNLRYIDPHKSDMAYMWLSAFRRIQRISNASRTDSIDGTDLIYDDEYGWDGQILRNTYRLTGTRELLCGRHVDIEKAVRIPGQALLNNVSRERTKTLVVEVVSRDPNYLYGKRIWYVDPETYLILWTEIYDRQMRYWKCFENLTNDIRTESGEYKNFIVGNHYLDFQRKHAGTWQNTRIQVGIELGPDMFTLFNLQRGGY